VRTAAVAIALLILATEARAVTIQLTCTDGRQRTAVQGRGRRYVIGAPYQYEICDIDRRRDGLCTFAIEADCLNWILGRENSEPPCAANLDHACDLCSYGVDERLAVSARRGRLVKRFGYHKRIRIVMRCRRARHSDPPTVPASGDLSGAWTLAGAVTSGGCPDPGPVSNPVEDTLYVQQAGTTLRARGRGAICYTGTVSDTTPRTFGLANRDGISCGPGPGSPFTAALDGTLTSPDAPLLRQSFTVGAGSCPACNVTWEGTMARRSCRSHADCTALHPCSRCVDGACR